MGDRAGALADRLFGPQWEAVVEACHNDPGLAHEVSDEFARQLWKRQAKASQPEDAVWIGVLQRLLTVSALPGSDPGLLASGLWTALTLPGNGVVAWPLPDDETLRWLIRHAELPTTNSIEEERRIGASGKVSDVEFLRRRVRRHWEEDAEGARSLGDVEPVTGAWTYGELIDAGSVRTPGGIACDSPFNESGPIIVVPTPDGEFPVRLAIADHPQLGSETAAAELRIGESRPARWEAVRSPWFPQWQGYAAAAGVGSFGAPATLPSFLMDPSATLEDVPDELLYVHPGTLEIDRGEEGSLVAFTVGPQDADCRTWVGFSEDGDPTAVVTDLELIDVDPTQRPLPWSAD